jgi:hypothetical protein
MNYSNPANLAVLACPGGEAFADEVIFHLKKIYRHKHDEIIAGLIENYHLSAEAVMERLNFLHDAAGLTSPVPVGGIHHPPAFKVPTRFTLFPNGEIKAEVLESIRGKDVYIVQDVENHHPLVFNEGALRQCLTINDHLMSIVVAVDAVNQAGLTVSFTIRPAARGEKGDAVVTQNPKGGAAANTGTILYAEVAIPANLASDEIYGLFSYNVPVGPAPVPLKLTATLPDGQTLTIASSNHRGGEFTFPYRLREGSVLVLSVLDRELYRVTVQR